MEELDPELQKILADSAFNSPGVPIIFPTPPGSGISAVGEVIFGPGMAIVAATPSQDVNPNTPPETPEAEKSMDIEIPDNFIDGLEESLAEPLGENLDDIFDIDEEDNALPEKETFRKKVKKPSKQDIAKEALNKGLEHLNVKGNLLKAKQMRPACENCRFKSSERLPQDQRESIFKKYWALGNKQQQDRFIR
ncbi:Cytosolic Fe-S cluster assembly factor NAR1 [Frankliniella fusca]|uniref:Cytosolic Fe-S cluster assembly factor NAR1 n=1 Tax=Frankliniella fusca TaxID=407009 RepID=A0AAE1HRK2_9NEOP|nr:Cytosolic Fe-S cluster assembly factor NAR1 [Frankliniella fusca]